MPKLPLRLRAAIVGVLYGVALGGLAVVFSPALPLFGGYVGRPACGDRVIEVLVSPTPVKGSLACLGGAFLGEAEQLGIGSDSDLHDAVLWQEGTWFYRGETGDGGYLYEVDQGGVSTLYTVYTDGDGRVVGIQ